MNTIEGLEVLETFKRYEDVSNTVWHCYLKSLRQADN